MSDCEFCDSAEGHTDESEVVWVGERCFCANTREEIFTEDQIQAMDDNERLEKPNARIILVGKHWQIVEPPTERTPKAEAGT